MLERDIARKLLAVEDMPTLPAVMSQLLGVVEDENSSAQDLTAILEQDLAISTRILRLANSAFYGLRYKVDSLRRAVVVIGFDAVRMLALATSVFDALSRQSQFAFDPEEFWLHSLGAAKAAQLMSKGIKGVESAEGCFTAALLHDMGKYCLALALKDDYAAIVRCAEQQKNPLAVVERSVLQTTHADVGMWLADKWRLPAMITDAVGYQHRPLGYTGPYLLEVAVVGLSSEFARMANYGYAGDYDPPAFYPPSMDRLGLGKEQADRIKVELGEYFEEARRFLGILQES